MEEDAMLRFFREPRGSGSILILQVAILTMPPVWFL